jgi:hypothetical protein
VRGVDRHARPQVHFTTYTGTDAGNALLYAPVYNLKDLTLIATLPGDANTGAAVNFNDLVSLAQHYNTTFPSTLDNWWNNGDFTYDGKVDFADLVLLAQNYNTSLTPTPAPILSNLTHDWALAVASVPEPTAPSLLAAAAAAATTLLRPRRRAARLRRDVGKA